MLVILNKRDIVKVKTGKKEKKIKHEANIYYHECEVTNQVNNFSTTGSIKDLLLKTIC